MEHSASATSSGASRARPQRAAEGRGAPNYRIATTSAQKFEPRLSSMRPAVAVALALVGSTAALSPRRVKVASWQGAAKTADVAANVERVSVEAAAAAERGVEVVVFPELFLHGYDATAQDLGVLALDEDEVAALVGPTAAAQGVCLAVPYCERFGDRLYNAMAVFDAFGALRCNYRKVNLWGPWERSVFARGDAGSFAPFDLATRSGASLRAGCLICFDQGRKRVIQRRLNMGVLEAISERNASTLRVRPER